MKIILVGANGKIGELVQKALAGAGHEIVRAGRKSGDFRVEIENRESVRKLYQAVDSFDAVAIAAGEVAFAPLSELTAEKWQFSLGSKLMGQINLVQEAIPFIKENGFNRLGRIGRFCSGYRNRTSQGIAYQFGESHDPRRIRT
jgi:NAD(P)-dependent dehydrogenase (short-subunit alcohol dehydrogenase family)